MGCFLWSQPIASPANPRRGNTTNRRAVCGKSARTVRRGGSPGTQPGFLTSIEIKIAVGDASYKLKHESRVGVQHVGPVAEQRIESSAHCPWFSTNSAGERSSNSTVCSAVPTTPAAKRRRHSMGSRRSRRDVCGRSMVWILKSCRVHPDAPNDNSRRCMVHRDAPYLAAVSHFH